MMRGVVLILVAVSASAVAPRFEPVQQPSLIVAGTLVNAFADYDGDGDPDMFVGSAGTVNRLYRNDNGTFTDVAADVGLADARPRAGRPGATSMPMGIPICSSASHPAPAACFASCGTIAGNSAM